MINSNYYGTNHSIAIKNIARRKTERLNPNAKNGIKSALIVQGGA